MAIDMTNLSAEEKSFVLKAPVTQITANNFGLHAKGELKLLFSFKRIMAKCLSRERYERLMTKDEYYINGEGELLMVLFDEQIKPFVVLDFQPNQFFIKQ